MSDLLGFVSAGALAWQALRLVLHQRAVRRLRQVSESRPGSKLSVLAERGADTLEVTVARWDARDQWMATIGVVGIALSFLLKLAAGVLAWHGGPP